MTDPTTIEILNTCCHLLNSASFLLSRKGLSVEQHRAITVIALSMIDSLTVDVRKKLDERGKAASEAFMKKVAGEVK